MGKYSNSRSAKEAFSKIPKEALKLMILDSPPVVQDSHPKSVQQRPETLEGFTTDEDRNGASYTSPSPSLTADPLRCLPPLVNPASQPRQRPRPSAG